MRSSPRHRALSQLRWIWDRTWVWRAAAICVALLVCALVAIAAPGSVEIVHQAQRIGSPAARATGWAQRCEGHPADTVHPQLAFCARVDGRVIYSDATSGSGETHLLVVGGFHVVLVELEAGSWRPAWGTRITAVGPLLRASSGQREIQAVWVGG